MAATVKDSDYTQDSEVGEWAGWLQRSLILYPERNTGPSDICMDLSQLLQCVDYVNLCLGVSFASLISMPRDEDFMEVWAHPCCGLPEVLRVALSATEGTAQIWSKIIHDLRAVLETGRNADRLLFDELREALNSKKLEEEDAEDDDDFEPGEWKTEIERCQLRVNEWISRVTQNLKPPPPQEIVRPVSDGDVDGAGSQASSLTHPEPIDASHQHTLSSSHGPVKIHDALPPHDQPVSELAADDGPLD
ncbi:hypothetical protein C8Q80DRAFT_1273561 [Daedaleopsis nitida]|nr:hypothetical protein C8Q80DRAFT_1273561 [Daedaleopsis nitida]